MKSSPPSPSWTKLLDRLAPLLGLGTVFLIFAVAAPESFVSTRNLTTIVRQTAIVGIASLGMTLVIISGGIDLSVGSLIALSTVVIAALLQHGVDPAPAALAAVLAAGACGMVSGLLITGLRLVPFIVTLGMLLVVRGAAKGLAGEQKIDAPLSWLNTLLAALGPTDRWKIVPAGVWVMGALAVAVWAGLRYTRLGRQIFAIGSNEAAARLCGIAVERVKIMVYSLSAGLAGLAGVMQFSRLTVGDPTVAAGLELDVIAAVVIGGGSLAGGRGSVPGTLIGALIMAVIRSGCSQMGLSNWIQEIVTGAIIVLAVALDLLRHRKN